MFIILDTAKCIFVKFWEYTQEDFSRVFCEFQRDITMLQYLQQLKL